MRLKRVISGIDWTQPTVSFLYTAVMAAGGLWIAVNSLSDWLAAPAQVLFFAALVCVAECMHVRLPHVNGYVSVASAICLASVIVLGGPGAAFVAAAGTFTANVFVACIPLDAAIFNAGQLAITAYLSGSVWQALGGTPGMALSFPQHLGALILTIATYALLNVTLATFGISLAMRKPIWDTLLASIKWAIPNYTGLGALGVLAADIYYSSLSMYGILLLWIPLLFARYSFQQYWEIRRAHVKTIEALALALDARDPNTRGHSERVALYAATMAAHLKMSDTQVEQIRFAGILHDIGKIGISDFILNKRGPLDPEEFDLIRRHPAIGADMVQSIGFLKDVADTIRHHHERFDGRGYPDKLRGEQIPLGSRIISVADAFDAMTCDRVYRPGISPQKAIAELELNKGIQFDATAVDCFIEVWHEVFDDGRLAPKPLRQVNEAPPVPQAEQVSPVAVVER